MLVCKRNEEFVYQAILSGDLMIDPDGSIWRVRKRMWDRWQKKAVSRPCKRVRAEHCAGKYMQVRIMIDKVRVHALAHRIVYRHTNGPIPDGMTVNHRDGRHRRNPPDNLELATLSEQQIHACHVLGTARSANQDGEANCMAKLTAPQVQEIKRRRSAGEKLRPIAMDFGISFQTVSKIAKGDRWRSGAMAALTV